jgi:NAD(P)-dependent dehydrogenase (short-subunit alcohol dehydrogenase family)
VSFRDNNMSHMDLTERVAIVTGAGRGIGLAISKRLVSAHASVGMIDIDERNLQKATRSLTDDGAVAAPFVCDVSDPDSVLRMVDGVLNTYSRVDILVNNAGIVGRVAPIQEVTDDDWNRMISIDLTGVFYCCRAVIPHMIARGSGRIVNIASIAGKEGNPKMVSYCAAKAGVIGFTKALAKEVAQHNILVNAISPALIQTSLLDDLTPDQVRYLTERIPMGRLGRPEEVAAMVHWLASDDASFSTGAVFDLSGGRATY